MVYGLLGKGGSSTKGSLPGKTDILGLEVFAAELELDKVLLGLCQPGVAVGVCSEGILKASLGAGGSSTLG